MISSQDYSSLSEKENLSFLPQTMHCEGNNNKHPYPALTINTGQALNITSGKWPGRIGPKLETRSPPF